MSSPPRWVEALLSSLLAAKTRESLLGDLLEQYRQREIPSRGLAAANRWYTLQALRIVWQMHAIGAVMIAGTVVVRSLLDWLWPTTDFELRASVSTALVALTLVGAGFAAGRRTGLVRAGAIAGATTALIAAAIANAASVVLLAFIWDDDFTVAVAASGGLIEVFTLPLTLILPGLVLGAFAGALGVVAHGKTLERGVV